MNPDDEAMLLLYLYGELAADEREALERRLSADPMLRHQLAQLRRDLATVDQILTTPAPDDGFEDRLWQRLEPKLQLAAADARSDGERLPLSPVQASHSRRQQARRRVRMLTAWAATVLLALSTGLWLGGRNVAPAIDSERVLTAQLGAHLRTTEQVFLLAQNQPQEGELAGRLARELVDSHRLYAAAAERAGRPQLAHALREMEPVLLELATSPQHTVDALLQQAITDADLPFKARSAAWAVQNVDHIAAQPRS